MRLTSEQYLEIERAAQDVRSEYYNGRMYAMSGGTHPHAIVIGNLGSELRMALKKGPCMVTTSDLRVRVNKSGLYTYPDIVVVCDQPQYGWPGWMQSAGSIAWLYNPSERYLRQDYVREPGHNSRSPFTGALTVADRQ